MRIMGWTVARSVASGFYCSGAWQNSYAQVLSNISETGGCPFCPADAWQNSYAQERSNRSEILKDNGAYGTYEAYGRKTERQKYFRRRRVQH